MQTPEHLSKYQYFPPNYATGRDWFEAAVKSRDGAFTRYKKPEHKGPEGEALSIDVGWFGDAGADKVHLALSGTHGQEYFCGAAGQLQWICEGGTDGLADDIAVCLVHAVNPYGAAHYSRTNEDLIDLNRNFRDPAVARPANQVFPAVAATIAKRKMDAFALYDVVDDFNAVMAQEDPLEVMTAIAGGQSMDPTGPAYCGTHETWEVSTLKSIADTFLSRAQQIALIDWHTGLGPSGEASVLTELDVGTDERRLADAWWGEPPAGDALYEGGREPDIEGDIRTGLAEYCEGLGARVVSTVVEIGTVDNRAIIPAFAIDRWLRVECKDTSAPDAVYFRTLMMERYSPSAPEWREKALGSMRALYDATFSGLNDWAPPPQRINSPNM